MKEKTRQTPATPASDQWVTVMSGPWLEQLPVGNTTVGEIRRRFSSRLEIDPLAQSLLDGRNVDNDTLVHPGQTLLFVRHAGQMGPSTR